jgi:dihydroorotate dehydrogenase (fumarate)
MTSLQGAGDNPVDFDRGRIYSLLTASPTTIFLHKPGEGVQSMASLKITYMGIELKNPIIVGACSMTSNMSSIKKIEEQGAAAFVFPSLFEEQIELERMKLEEELSSVDNLHPEMIDVFPDLEHAGPKEHLLKVRKAKESVSIPVFASLNCINRETWADYALQLADTGVDGLELNFFATPSEFERSGADIENEQVDILTEIRSKVKVPISVKLSINYTNPLNFIRKLDDAGVDGFVLFNRFFQPDIDIDEVKNTFPFNFSSEVDNRLPLRYAGLLFGNLKADVCSSTGIILAKDVIKMLLAGSTCVQVVTSLYKHKVSHLKTMTEAVERWMEEKSHADIESFRGKLSRKNSSDPWRYTRSQYAKLLLHPEEFLKTAKII